MPHFRSSHPLAGLLLVLVVATLWRTLLFAELRDTPLADWHTWDQSDMHSFWEQGRAIAAGDWLARRPYVPYHKWMQDVAPPENWARWHRPGQFYQPPLYSYFLAALIRTTRDPATTARLIQLALGVLTCGLLYSLVRRLFGGLAGLAAGLIAAIYGPLLMVETQLLRDALILFWVTLAFWLYSGWARRMGADCGDLGPDNEHEHDSSALRAPHSGLLSGFYCRGLLLGLLLGVMAMLHEAALFITLILLGLGAVRARRALGRGWGWRWVGVLVVGFVLGFAPLALRNLALGLPPLPQFAGSALAFAVANHATAPHGGVLWQSPSPELAEALRRAGGRPLALVGEVLRSYGPSVWWRWPAHWGLRLLALAAGGENSENLCYAYFKLRSPILNLALDFRALLPLAVAGLLLWGAGRWPAGALRQWATSFRRGATPAALLAYGLATALMISAVLPLGRYRLALLPLLVPFAGRAVADLHASARDRRGRRVVLLVVLVGAVALAQWGIDRALQIGRLRSLDFLVASRILHDWGHPEMAEAELKDAVAHGLDDSQVVSQWQLLRAEQSESLGDEAMAAREYDQVLAMNPGHPYALTRLAWIKATSPDPKVRSGRRALELARERAKVAPPEPARALDLEAAAQAELGNFPAAVTLATQALAQAQAASQAALAREIAGRLALYQQKQPYHHPPVVPPPGHP